MSVQQIQSELEKISVQILQDWAMMLCEPAETTKDLFDQGLKAYVATLEFRGLVSGRYSVVCQSPFVEALKGNLLGEGEEDAEGSLGEDAVKEMVNVLSGNLITSTFGADTPFELTSPTVRIVTLPEVRELAAPCRFSLRADGQPLTVCFQPLRTVEDER